MTTTERTVTLRPTKEEYGLGIAVAASARADCVRRRVGAAIFSRDGRVQALGYNGSPPGRKGCLTDGACPRGASGVEPGSSYDTGPGSCIAIHAEANALLHAAFTAIRGGTIYVTHKPCDGCRKLIQAAGLARVIFPDDDGMPVVELP